MELNYRESEEIHSEDLAAAAEFYDRLTSEREKRLTQMQENGADYNEAVKAVELWDFLRPMMRVKPNGRVDTLFGDITPLGLYRTLKTVIGL